MDHNKAKNLLEKCKMGDRKSQRKFFEQYGPFVKGVVSKYFSDPGQIEDSFIKAMYKILTKLDTLENEATLFAWMRRIAANEALMDIRKSKSRPNAEPISEREFELKTNPTQSLDMELILQALESLPEGYRNVFNLYEIDGFKHREVADILGISINTSKSQLVMAKKRLRSILEKLGFTGTN